MTQIVEAMFGELELGMNKVYPSLLGLLQGGYIIRTDVMRTKVYSITNEGREILGI